MSNNEYIDCYGIATDGLSAYIGPIKWILSFIETIIRKEYLDYSLL